MKLLFPMGLEDADLDRRVIALRDEQDRLPEGFSTGEDGPACEQRYFFWVALAALVFGSIVMVQALVVLKIWLVRVLGS
jgi:hypothetical protein